MRIFLALLIALSFAASAIIFSFAATGSDAAPNAGDKLATTLQQPHTLLSEQTQQFPRQAISTGDFSVFWQARDMGFLNDCTLTPPGTIGGWQEGGFDLNSDATDTLFEDSESDEYRLRPHSPALKLGLVPLSLAKMGLSGYDRSWKMPPR